MTVEEKAKAYDEALEKARKRVATEPQDRTAILKDIFPQLRDSEDERIRKDIIAFLQSMNSHCDPTQDWDLRNRWLPYLEKQKEQKPAEWNPTNEDVILFNKAITTNTALTPAERAKLDIIRMKFKHCNGNIANPTEWSEEDELMRNAVICTLERFEGRGTTEMQISWLKSLRPKPHWKPSEEQMEALNAINCHGGLSYVGQQNQLISLYNDLKKLM